MAKILLVEDDPEYASSIELVLAEEKHTVEAVTNGPDGLDRLRFYDFDVAILDWNLPGLDGIDVCRQFRSSGGKTPIIMLTGKDTIIDKESGLDAGADDYLTKPFHPRELHARIRALLRRPADVTETVLRAGAIEMDLKNQTVTKNGQPVRLLPRELALLEFLMRHPNQLFSTDTLLNRVWSSEADVSAGSVKVYVNRLRSKIDTEGQPSLICNVHGMGYIFQP